MSLVVVAGVAVKWLVEEDDPDMAHRLSESADDVHAPTHGGTGRRRSNLRGRGSSRAGTRPPGLPLCLPCTCVRLVTADKRFANALAATGHGGRHRSSRIVLTALTVESHASTSETWECGKPNRSYPPLGRANRGVHGAVERQLADGTFGSADVYGVPIRILDLPAGGTIRDPVESMNDEYQPSGSASPSRPQCGTSMVRRKARRDRNAGRQFWDHGVYPECGAIRPLGPDAASDGTSAGETACAISGFDPSAARSGLPIAWIDGTRRSDFIPEHMTLRTETRARNM